MGKAYFKEMELMWGEEEMHHEVPESRKIFHAGNCTLFVKVNRLSSEEKKEHQFTSVWCTVPGLAVFGGCVSVQPSGYLAS